MSDHGRALSKGNSAGRVSPSEGFSELEREEAIALYEARQQEVARTDDPIERARLVSTYLVLKNGKRVIVLKSNSITKYRTPHYRITLVEEKAENTPAVLGANSHKIEHRDMIGKPVIVTREYALNPAHKGQIGIIESMGHLTAKKSTGIPVIHVPRLRPGQRRHPRRQTLR